MASRRAFIRGLGTVATTTAIAGCGAPGETSSGGGTDTADSGGSGDSTTAASGDSGGEWTEASTVEMTDQLAYEPKQVQVSAGTTLTFENVGSIGHTVTAYEDKIPDGATYFASGGFDSEQAAKDGYADGQQGNIPAEESWEVTLETTGTYEYYCIPHEMNGMVGKIKVL